MIGNEKRKEFTMKMLLIYYLIKRNFRFFLRNQNNETNKNSVGNSDQIMNLLQVGNKKTTMEPTEAN